MVIGLRAFQPILSRLLYNRDWDCKFLGNIQLRNRRTRLTEGGISSWRCVT